MYKYDKHYKHYKHMNMVFSYINYIKSWECQLTTDREHRIIFYGYGATIQESIGEAMVEYQNAPEAVRKPL